MAKSVSTRERILQEGLHLVSKAGLAGVTLGVLAEVSGMSKSGLFAHFGSKEEVQLGLLDETVAAAQRIVVAPAMRLPEGLARLRAVVQNWLGWTVKAGLGGGCPIAGGMFELDDLESPVRDRLVAMESQWRAFLRSLAEQAVAHREFRSDLDLDQFVWELCGIYLSHHVSLRFVREPEADTRAWRAFETLLKNAATGTGRKKEFGRRPNLSKRSRKRERPSMGF